MTSRDFCYWLQGVFEVANPLELGERQTTMIKNHLALVFKHEIDPSMPDPTGTLQAIHDGVATSVTGQTPPSKIGQTGPNGEIYRC